MTRIARLSLPILLLTLLGSISLAAEPGEVYVSKNGTAYHRADCPRLRGAIPFVRSDAARRYKPCQVCRPHEAARSERLTMPERDEAELSAITPVAPPLVAPRVLSPETSAVAAPNLPLRTWIARGDRVRIVAGSERYVGLVIATEPESLVLRRSAETDPVSVPLTDISRLERSRGTRRHTLRGIGIGLGAGLLIGVGASVLEGHSPGIWYFEPTVERALYYGAITAIFTTPIGAVAGTLTNTERWQTVPRHRFQLGVVPRADGGVALGGRVNS